MNKTSSFSWTAILAGMSSFIHSSPAGVPDAAPALTHAPIPWDQIGAKAGADYRGDGLRVTAQDDYMKLNCVFQRLEGEATPEGLWLTSTVTNQVQDRFRVVATALGRTGSNPLSRPDGHPLPTAWGEGRGEEATTSCCAASRPLARTGKVTVADQTVRYERPGLVEEYTVSMDGIRQDFVVLEKPLSRPDGHPLPTAWGEGWGAGADELRLELAASGARVERTAAGAQLVLAESGRKIAYSRLRVTDATGRELPARMEVTGTTTDSVFRTLNSALSLAIVVDDTAATYPIRIDPTFSDANWIVINPSIPGADNAVFAAVVDGSGSLYIGGNFTVAGGVVANRIAKWDGSSWSALGSGMNGDVSALAVSGTNLYAGGWFTTAGGVAANRVAKWDENSWSALGAGMNDFVEALAVSGSDLYAGGWFTTAGDATANYVAKWNGSSWSTLGAGMDSYVYALAVSGSDLYVGGSFTAAGDVTANYVARWNGSSWSALGSGIGGDFPSVSALVVSGSDLYAGGSFTAAGGVAATNIAKWDGNQWSALGSGVNSTVVALAVSGSDLYVGGNFSTAGGVTANGIAKWDGSSWSALGSGIGGDSSFVSALAVAGSDLYAGGDFKTAGGKVSPYLARAVSGESPTPIPLQWQLQNQRLVLSWTDADFQLQAAPEATGTYTNVPNATSPYTNPLTGPRRFFRLHAP